MTYQLNLRLTSFYHKASRAAGGIVFAIGFLVLAGWLFDIPTLTSILPGLATMKANTALAFMLAGNSLWLAATRHENPRIDLVAKTCATLVLLIGLLTLSEYLFNWNLGIDQLLFKDLSTPESAHPGRMSPVTALNFSLLGLPLLLPARHPYRRLMEVLSITALLISALVLIGYIYGVPSLYEFSPHPSIAVHTAFAFSILCLGILLAHPEQGLMKIFSGDNLSGMMARRLTVAAVAVPFLWGWLFLIGQRMGFYDSAMRLALSSMSIVISLAILILWTATLLQRADLVRQQTQTQLSRSEERFQLAVEAAPNAIILADQNGNIVMVNSQAARFFGYSRIELVGLHVDRLVPERYRGIHPRHRQSFLADPQTRAMGAGRDLYGVRKDGSEFPVEIGLTPLETQEGLLVMATIVDITERKQAEEEIHKFNAELEQRVADRTTALSQTNSLLQMMLDHMPDQIYFKDAQSRFIRNSRSQARALGLSDPAEAVGKSDFDFFPHAQLSFDKEQEIIRSGQPLVDEEERVVWPDGQETWVSTTKMPLPDESGQIIGTFGISRDITERKRAEVAIQKAKLELEAANKELEAFSYSVSHDLRSPLRTIDGFSQALLEDYAEQLPEEGQNYLKRVRAATQRMGQLIDDLLNLSKVTRASMKLVPVDLSGLARGIVAELQRAQPERGVNFKLTPNLKARGDPGLLQAVLENLLNNAWKFTSKREQAEIELGSKYENDETVFFIRDNGAGFDMAYAGKLFGAFQRLHAMTEYSGTGIGLATVQRIINRHGGRIWAEGAVDQGATFFFTLPALERAKPEARLPEKDSLARRVREII